MRILEIITEPDKVYVNSTFKLKILLDKIRLKDIKVVTCNELKKYTVKEIREG